MNLRSENGFTGTDIMISVIILFISTTIIATLSYNFNIAYKEIERRSDAVNIAVNEIELIKSNGFEQIVNNDISCTDQLIRGNNGYYKTINVQDYADTNQGAGKQRNVVKRVTVTIKYKFKNQWQKVELSTILSKENKI